MPERPQPIPEGAATPWRRLVERASELVEFRPREAVALGILCLAVVAGAAFAYARSLPKGAAAAPAGPVTSPSAEPSGTPSGTIFVHMAGAVRSPGVYELAAGSRVIDGARAAGGPAPEADLSAINLARVLVDGERVYIPRRGEVPPAEAAGPGDPGSGGGASGGKVNINTASETQLEDLPGIGQVLAQRIIDYREQHGPFHAVKDL